MTILRCAPILGSLWARAIAKIAALIFFPTVSTLTDVGMLIAALQSNQGNYKFNKKISYGT